ncbi:hypothetical protein BKA93DRAFT_88126 [Sparassis latifolia]
MHRAMRRARPISIPHQQSSYPPPPVHFASVRQRSGEVNSTGCDVTSAAGRPMCTCGCSSMRNTSRKREERRETPRYSTDRRIVVVFSYRETTAGNVAQRPSIVRDEPGTKRAEALLGQVYTQGVGEGQHMRGSGINQRPSKVLGRTEAQTRYNHGISRPVYICRH